MTTERDSDRPAEPRPPVPVLYRWVVLFFVSLPMLGNYYIYDAINPLADVFEKQLGFTNQDIGWLNSSYSVAAILTLMLGGVIIDRIGVRKAVAIFSVICVLGAIITASHGTVATMIVGRVVLGLGAESLIVAVTVSLAKWFKGKELSFAFGVNLLVARVASLGADRSPSWAGFAFYPDGPGTQASWRGPLVLAVGVGLLCIVGAAVYWWLEARAERRFELGEADEVDRLDLKGLFKFDRSYWYVVVLCFTFYSAIFPFRTFAMKFYQHAHFADLAPEIARQEAGHFQGLLPLSAMVATPLFGLLVDRVGKRALFMVFGSVLLMPVYLLMAYTDVSLYVPMALMGVAFSLIPAVMWPSVAYIIDAKKLGAAYALMTLIQQIGFFLFNWLIGWANDYSGAGADNPAGYQLGMWLFSVLGFVGVTFAILLRRVETGPKAHGLETITAKGQQQAQEA